MDIIFEGKHDSDEAAEQLASVIQLFKERYHIGQFREMHLSLTLMDDMGEDVELVDTETAQVYRAFQVYSEGNELQATGKKPNRLKLVVDNT